MYTIYRHYRGMLYMCIGTALHSESLEPHEVYRCLYDNEVGRTWVRPQAMFHEKIANGDDRFTPVGRFRRAAPREESEIISFGFDVWGEGKTLQEYVAQSLAVGREQRAERFMFEGLDGRRLSKVNVLRFADGLVGFASLATRPEERGKGYGSIVLRAAMEMARLENADTRFLLFSEVKPAIYERLGFHVLDDTAQRFKPSLAMATGSLPLSPDELVFLENYF